MDYMVGIDEVGRGALAGPVVVAAVAMPAFFLSDIVKDQIMGKIGSLRESKRLTAGRRESWVRYLKNNKKIFWRVKAVGPEVIDRINIRQAANLAAKRALRELLSKQFKEVVVRGVVLDGGLEVNFKEENGFAKDIQFQKTVIRADWHYPEVALASIVAKVVRDEYMVKMHRKYPVYEFYKHKGYATKKHIEMIRQEGHSPLHRLSFLSKIEGKR